MRHKEQAYDPTRLVLIGILIFVFAYAIRAPRCQEQSVSTSKPIVAQEKPSADNLGEYDAWITSDNGGVVKDHRRLAVFRVISPLVSMQGFSDFVFSDRLLAKARL